jgi:RNA polymerase sigma-70 factor (ECF subfamily)
VDGDDLAPFAEAFERTHERLWRALLAYAGDPEVASDAAAEAYAQAVRRGVEIVDVDRWVWRAAFRIAAGELTRRRREGPVADPPALDAPVEAVELIDALRHLSDRQRRAVVLRYVGGYSAVEIARFLGTTAGSVRVSLLRARRTLRSLLEDDDA